MSTVGVVIPTLNEACNLPELLGDLREVALPLHVIVADGGSHDDTAALAQAGGATVVHTARGRAVQMNGGARACGAEWLCFLHADVRLPENARHDFEHLVRDPAAQAAVWSLAIDADGWWFRVLEQGARVRDRLGGFPLVGSRRRSWSRHGDGKQRGRIEPGCVIRPSSSPTC